MTEFCIPCLGFLPREVDGDIDIIDGGIDLEIIVTGSSSEGNANVEGWGSGERSLGDCACCLSGSVDVVSRGVRGLTSRSGGSSLTALTFGMLERSVNKASSFNIMRGKKEYSWSLHTNKIDGKCWLLNHVEALDKLHLLSPVSEMCHGSLTKDEVNMAGYWQCYP